MTTKKDLYNCLLKYFLSNPDSEQFDVTELVDKAFNDSSKEIVHSYVPIKVELNKKETSDFEAKQANVQRKTYKDRSTFDGYE